MTLRCSRAKHVAQAEATAACLLVGAAVVAVVEATLTTGRINRGRPVKIDRIVAAKVTSPMRHPAATGTVVGVTRISNSLRHRHGNPHRLDTRALALVRRRLRLPLAPTRTEVLLTATPTDSNSTKAKGMDSTARRSIRLRQADIRDSNSTVRPLGRSAVMVMALITMAGDVEGIPMPGITGSVTCLIALSSVLK